MPLGGKSSNVDLWNGVLEKCEKKLARWKTIFVLRWQTDSHQFSLRCLANLHDDFVPNTSRSHQEIGEEITMARKQGEERLSSGEVKVVITG